MTEPGWTRQEDGAWSLVIPRGRLDPAELRMSVSDRGTVDARFTVDGSHFDFTGLDTGHALEGLSARVIALHNERAPELGGTPALPAPR
jgi:predicted NUDIX family NTP pyrophosphohydrolase